MTSPTVHSELVLRLVLPDGPSLPVRVGLAYTPDDPWAVRIAFDVDTPVDTSPDSAVETGLDQAGGAPATSTVDVTGGGQPGRCPGEGRDGGGEGGRIEWLVARSLLQDGLSSRSGCGDLQVWPAGRGGLLRMAMSSPSGEALFELDRDGLERFLRSTSAVVPPGQESTYVDLDAELGLLLARER